MNTESTYNVETNGDKWFPIFSMFNHPYNRSLRCTKPGLDLVNAAALPAERGVSSTHPRKAAANGV